MAGRWGLLAGVAFGMSFTGCSQFNTTIGTPTPAAAITVLSPSSINAGSAPFILTVTGSPFASNSVVQWNLVNLTTTFVSSSEVTAVVPASDVAQAGTVNITVNTPGSAQSNPSQGILVQDESNVLPFLVSGAGNPVPTITSAPSPSSIAAGSVPCPTSYPFAAGTSFTVRVIGTNFVPGQVQPAQGQMAAQFLPGSVVNWAGSISMPLPMPPPAPPANSPPFTPLPSTTQGTTTYVSSTEVDATVSGCLAAVAGTVRISVTNPVGGAGNTGGGSSGTVIFTISDPPQKNAKTNGGLSATSAIGPLSPAISSDHRYLAFVAPVPDPTSDASTGPTNVYVRDTCAGVAESCAPATTLISVAADGSAANGASGAPSISADGRYVSFVSTASNLVAAGSSGNGEIFVRDTCTGAPTGCVPATTLVSLAADGSFANGPSDSPYLSANGRYVVFQSSATNLLPDAVSSAPGIYMRDLCTGGPSGCQVSTVLLSVSGTSATSP